VARSIASRIRRVVLALVPIVVVALAIGVPLAFTKSYSFPEVRVDATVLPDGSLRLVEHRTFDFDGDFSFAFFTIAWPFEQIRDFEVSENGRPLPVDEEAEFTQFKATWHFDAQDERRTFRISYRALCAVDVWEDTAHLLWQFVGTGWTEPTDNLAVRVHLPEASQRELERPPVCQGAGDIRGYAGRPLRRGETRAWGHGPLTGEVRIVDPQTVELTVTDVPAATFVEGSILFPPEAVPRAAQVPAKLRATILAQEATLAELANDQRRAFLEEERAREAWSRRGWFAVAALPVLFVLLVVVARLRDRTPGIPRVIPDPPEDIHPMDLVQLWGAYRGAVDTQDAYRTQLLHLAKIGAIEMHADGRVSDPEDIRVRLKDLPRDGSLDLEFAEFLFADGEEWVPLGSIKPKGKRKTELKEWWEKAKDTARAGFGSVTQMRWEGILTTLLGVGGFVLGIALLALAGGVGGVLLAVSVVGMIAAHIAIPTRLRPEFRERLTRWTSFRRFLKEFSSLPDAPALAVVIWEQYLVYATALGIADQVEKQVKALIPEEELPAPWPGAPSGIQSFLWVNAFHDATPAQVASWVMPRASSSGGSSWSSGGGFGGGFSGGGGGGGGGTGGGAG
jgi:uncharacterized membrane protein YgcG